MIALVQGPSTVGAVPQAARPGAVATALAAVYCALLAFPAVIDLPGGVSPGQILMIGSLPIWWIAFLSRQGRVFDATARRGAAVVLSCSAFLILWAILSAFEVDIPFRAARPALSLATAFAMYFMVIGCATPGRLRLLCRILCWSLAVTGVITIVAMVEPNVYALIYQDKDRAYGFFKNPNQYGIALSTTLPVAIALLFAERGRRVRWAICVGILGVALMASGSKANLLITALVVPGLLVLATIIRFQGPERVIMLMMTAVGCIVAGSGLVLALSIVNPRALSILSDVVVDGDATGSIVSRGVIWAESLDLMRASPLFGVGAGQPIEGLSHSHNVLIDYGRTLGIPGLVFVTGMIVAICVVCALSATHAVTSHGASRADRHLCTGLAVSPVAYLAANFSSDSLGPTTSPYLYVFLFLSLAGRSLMHRPVRGWRA